MDSLDRMEKLGQIKGMNEPQSKSCASASGFSNMVFLLTWLEP